MQATATDKRRFGSKLFAKASDQRVLRAYKRLRFDGCVEAGCEHVHDLKESATKTVFSSARMPCPVAIIEDALEREIQVRELAPPVEGDSPDCFSSSDDEVEQGPDLPGAAFSYARCLSGRSLELLSKKVTSIKFPRVQFKDKCPDGVGDKVLHFPEAISISRAIRKAEEYLSQKMPMKFYRKYPKAYSVNPAELRIVVPITRGLMLGDFRALLLVDFDEECKRAELFVSQINFPARE